MPDRSTRRVNRHGIPFRGPEPKQCCWPGCGNTVAKRYHPLPLCDVHARRTSDFMMRWDLKQAEGIPPPSTPVLAVKPEIIYFLRVGSYIKIGWTADLPNRMRSYPPDSRLLVSYLGSRDDEQQLHRKFAVWRSHGREWYTLAPVILEYVKLMVAKHGEPVDPTFGAQPVEVPQLRPRAVIYPRGWRGNRPA